MGTGVCGLMIWACMNLSMQFLYVFADWWLTRWFVHHLPHPPPPPHLPLPTPLPLHPPSNYQYPPPPPPYPPLPPPHNLYYSPPPPPLLLHLIILFNLLLILPPILHNHLYNLIYTFLHLPRVSHITSYLID